MRSFTDSLSTVFVIAAAVVAVSFVLAWMLEERPLRRTIEDRDLGDALPPPQAIDSLSEITRELSRCVGRDRTRRFIERVIADAGVDLTPAEGVVLARSRDGLVTPAALVAMDPDNAPKLHAGLAGLQAQGLVAPGELPAAVTEDGRAIRAQLLQARERDLRSLVADWEPEDPAVDRMFARLAEALAHQQALAA